MSLNRSEQNPTNESQTVDLPFEHQKWNHLVLVTNTSNSTKLTAYLNGNPVGSYSTGTITYNNGGNVAWIGGQYGINQYWDGQISNLQIWNTDLSSTEVATLYNNGQPLMTGTQPEAANLKAWYKLNQSANWAADVANMWQIPDNRSAYPHSFNFNGSSDIITTSSSLFSGINKFTISLWANLTANSTANVAYSLYNDSSNRLFLQFWNGQLYIRINSGSDAGTYTIASGVGNWNSNTVLQKWGNVTIVYDGTKEQSNDRLRVWVNGDANTSGSYSGTFPTSLATWTDSFYIGAEDGASSQANFLNGKLSNIAIWNSDQSTEISNIYNNGIPATSYTNTPSAWYKLDNTSVWYENTGQWGIPNAASTNTQIINFSN